ncbi:MAG: hypothetical protein HY747_05790 [Elusimicrobia bacterium]|nr:hypothetical protein [Elusimicrobiota bacterium]
MIFFIMAVWAALPIVLFAAWAYSNGISWTFFFSKSSEKTPLSANHAGLPPDILDKARRFRKAARSVFAAALTAFLLGLLSLAFAGCRQDHASSGEALRSGFSYGLEFLAGLSRSLGSPKVLRGHIVLGDESLTGLVNTPNAVCLLLAKDNWGVPVAVNRWLNPKFPLFFRITSSDLIVPSRHWQGPFHLEAYLFLSQNKDKELPPPADAVRCVLAKPVYPAVMQSLELVLGDKNET